MGLRDGVADGQHQPVSRRVQHEPHLVGGRVPAGGAVGGQLRFVEFDQVLGLTAGAVEVGVEPFGRAGGDVRDHVADVEAEPRGLDAGSDAALLSPGLGRVRGLGKAAHRILVVDGPRHPDRVGGVLDLGGERLGAGQAEDVGDPIILAPVHRLRPAVMAVTPDGDRGVRPVAADRPDEPTQMAPHLATRGRLARAQDHRDGTAGGGVVDVDRQKAALSVMSVEQRQLLLAVHHITGVVDVESNGGWRHGVTGAVEVDQHPPEPDEVAQARRVLQPRDGGLAHQVRAAVGQAAAGELEGWIGAQMVEVIGILVPAGDGQDACQQDLGQRMQNPARITPVRDHRGELLGDAQPSGSLGEQQDAAVRGQASAVKRSCELLAPDGWKRERETRRIGHGGRGGLDAV